MSFQFVISIITAVILVILGLFTFSKNRKSATHLLFTFLAVVLASWTITNYFSLHSSTEAETLFWIRIIMFITSFMGPALFLLIHTYPGEKFTLRKKYYIPILILTCLSAFFALTPYMFVKVVFTPDKGSQPTPGPAIILFAINFFSSVIAGFFIVIKKYLRARGIEKLQIRYLLLGLTITYALFTTTNFVFVVFLKITSFVPYGPIFNLIMATFISYAIVRHRLMDIRLVVARTVSYSLLLTLLGSFYAFSMFFISSFLFPVTANGDQLAVSAFLALIIAFTFQPLRRWLENVTDRFFFKERYNPEFLLGTLSRLMASTLLLNEICQGVLKEISEKMKISRGALVLAKNHQGLRTESVGYSKPPFFKFEQAKMLMEVATQPLILEELPEGELKDLMRQLDLTFIISLKVKEGKTGLLVLGEKASGDIYSGQDIEVLEILAPQLAVAVQNAQAYEEIKNFSATLEEKIDQATKNLQKANLKLRELSDLKDEFVSVASHELRAPMTAIKGYTSMILDGDLGKIPPKVKEFLKDSYDSNDRMIRLVNNMLNVSRIESGRLVIDLQDVQLEPIIESLVKEFEIQAKEHGLELKYFPPKENLPKVRVDPDRIREIISNLVGNAINFTASGYVYVKNQIEDGMVITEVEDTGVGISRENQKRLFKKFSQVDGAFMKKGSGLGLYICKMLLNEFGGKIWLNSKVGKGTTFYFSLPGISSS